MNVRVCVCTCACACACASVYENICICISCLYRKICIYTSRGGYVSQYVYVPVSVNVNVKVHVHVYVHVCVCWFMPSCTQPTTVQRGAQATLCSSWQPSPLRLVAKSEFPPSLRWGIPQGRANSARKFCQRTFSASFFLKYFCGLFSEVLCFTVPKLRCVGWWLQVGKWQEHARFGHQKAERNIKTPENTMGQ